MGDMPLVWTVDFDRNLVFYDREGQHFTYEFSLPEKVPIRLRHFQPYVPMQLPIARSREMSRLCSMDAAPQDEIPEVLFDFIYRLASDYEHNWRSSGLTIQRYGLHHLAMGILSCFTMNFHVRTVAASHRQPSIAWNDFRDLLRWRVWPSPQVVPTVSFGSTQIIFTERMDLATSLVHEHFNSVVMDQPYLTSHNRHRLCDLTMHYVVTSIQELQYFTKTVGMQPPRMTCTPAIPFFDGSNPPSKTGVAWLLSALYKQVYLELPPVRNLPLEIQEIIIDYICPPSSYDAFDRAVFSAKLGIGLSFNFQVQGHSLVLCAVNEDGMIQPTQSVYQLEFWDRYAGLTYQVEKGKMDKRLQSPWDKDDVQWHMEHTMFQLDDRQTRNLPFTINGHLSHSTSPSPCMLPSQLQHISKVRILSIRQILEREFVPLLLIDRQRIPPLVLPPQHKVQRESRHNRNAVTNDQPQPQLRVMSTLGLTLDQLRPNDISHAIRHKDCSRHGALLRRTCNIRHAHGYRLTNNRAKRSDSRVSRHGQSGVISPLTFPDHSAARNDR